MTAQTFEVLLDRPGLIVIYDGQCPFCDAYVRILRLRDSIGTVELIDARQHPALVRECNALGYPLNEGMIALLGSNVYFGAEAVALLSQMTTASGPVNKIMAGILKRPRMARICYPVMKSGRAAVLKILNRQPL